MPNLERFSVVWQECGAESKIASRFFVPGYKGYLPFFISGEELFAFEQKESVELKEKHLLKGILYGLYEFDHYPKPWNKKEDRETLLYLLDVLNNGFNFESPEKMILSIAAGVRDENGSTVSRRVLEVGQNLMPQSSKIKSDLAFDLWACASMQDDFSGILEEIVTLFHNVDLADINPDAKEILCYYGLCSVVLLRRESQISDFLAKYIYPNVKMDNLKHRIKTLLDGSGNQLPKDLMVT